MEQANNPEGLILTKQKFNIFTKEFNSDLPFSYYKSNKTKELAMEICPLVKASISATSKAIKCIRLPNQFEREKNCNNRECPLLNDESINLSVKGTGALSSTYQLNPASGEITTINKIKQGRPKDFPNGHSEYIPKIVEPIDPNQIPFAQDLKNVLTYENRTDFRKKGIKIPKTITNEFLIEQTEFRTIGPLKDVVSLPIDGITLDIAGWAYQDSCLEPITLSKRADYTVDQTLLRMPLIIPIVNDVNSAPFPIFRFMEVHKMYEDQI